MPPWPPGSARPTTSARSTRILSAQQRATILAWAQAGGKVDGPARKPAAPKRPGGACRARRCSTCGCRAPYRPSAPKGVTDDYRCFLLDPKLTGDAFVTSARIEPGPAEGRPPRDPLPRRADPGRRGEAARRAATPARAGRASAAPAFRQATARGSPTRSNNANWIAAWAPGWGGEPPPGGHRRPAAGRKPDRDAGALQPPERPRAGSLARAAHRRARVGRSSTPLQTVLLPGPVELACAKGEQGTALRPERGALRPRAEVRRRAPRSRRPVSSSSAAGAPRTRAASAVSTCDRRITTPTTIHVAAGHMHLLGASIRLELNPGTPRAQVLLDIPRWDFHWQNAYTLARSGRGGAGRRRAGHVPPRRAQATRTAATAFRRRRATSSGARARPTRCASGSCRSRAGSARCESSSSRRCTRGRTTRTSGSSSRTSSASSSRAATRSSARSSTRAAAGSAVTSRSSATPVRAARRFHPDVVYAHFLVPAGLAAALASRAPLVVTAHGQDVANIGSNPGVRAATRYVVRRAATVIAVSRWLRDQLERPCPRRAARPRSSTAASTSSASRRATRRRLAREARLERRRDGVPLPRRPHGAQERPPARARVRAARRGHAHVRRRRPAPRARSRDGPGIRLVGRVGHDDGARLDRRVRRRLPAEPRRAVRSRDARGDGVGALGRRDHASAARPSS